MDNSRGAKLERQARRLAVASLLAANWHNVKYPDDIIIMWYLRKVACGERGMHPEEIIEEMLHRDNLWALDDFILAMDIAENLPANIRLKPLDIPNR